MKIKLLSILICLFLTIGVFCGCQEQEDKDDSEHERRRHNTQIRDNAHEVIDELIFVMGRQYAQADTQAGGDH